MTNPYRAMCAELVDDLEMSDWPSKLKETFRADITRARALLAQPVAQEGGCSGCEGTPVASNSPCAVCGRIALTQPEPVAPTDEEIEEWADACPEAPLEEMDPEIHGWRRCFTAKEFSETIRAALARWGRPTPQPVAASERLPGPGDCDEQGRCWLLTVEDEYPQWRLHSIEGAQPGGAMIWVPVDSSPGVMVDCFYTSHWLPANALPTPEATND